VSVDNKCFIFISLLRSLILSRYKAYKSLLKPTTVSTWCDIEQQH